MNIKALLAVAALSVGAASAARAQSVELQVIVPFGSYQRGQIISDPSTVQSLLNTYGGGFFNVLPAGTPAPVIPPQPITLGAASFSGNLTFTAPAYAILPTWSTPPATTAGVIGYDSATGRWDFGIGGSVVNHVRLGGDTMTGALTAPGLTSTGALAVTGAATFSGTLQFNQPASIAFNGSRTWSGTQTANGNAQIYSYTNQSGSTSTGNPVAFHFFGVASDTLQSPSAGAATVYVEDTTGAGITGTRNAVWVSQTMGGKPGDAGQYTAGTFSIQASAAANAGGNSMAASNPTCGINGTATGTWSCTGEEIDVAARSGSAPLLMTGLTVVTVTGDVVHGSQGYDSAISLGNQSASNTGWDYGLRFGGPGPGWPMLSTGTLIGAYQSTNAMTAANGIDFHLVTFTGNTWNDGHIVLTGAGAMTINAPTGGSEGAGTVNVSGGYYVNGVLQSAPLSATSASIGGSALLAGACSTTATTVPGATVGMAIAVTPTTYPGAGNIWDAYVSAANTVTTEICAIVAATPVASTYNIRVFN